MDESVVKQFEEQRVGKLKLSAAIRIGCLIRPNKCTRSFYGNNESCALGAAWEGAGYSLEDIGDMFNPIIKAFGISASLADEIATMNDGGLSREFIADLLEARGL